MLLQPIGPLRTRRLAVGITTAIMLAAVVLAAFVATGGRTALGAGGGGGPCSLPPGPTCTFKSINTFADFGTVSADGCVFTDASVQSFQALTSPRHAAMTIVFVSISSFDNCTGASQTFVNFNPTSSDFPIFNGTALFGTKLDTASVNGSAPMFDINTGLQAFTSNVNVVWTGFGPTTTFIDSFHVRTTGVLFIAHSNSTSRGAEASGTITDIAGNNDASVPTLNAQLQNATQGSISISKS